MRVARAAGGRQRSKVLKNVQRLEHCDPARRCRRHRDERVPAIRARDRRAPDRLVALQICHGDDSAASLHFGHERVGNLPFIKRLWTLLGDHVQGSREVWLLEDRAALQCLAARAEQILAAELRNEAVARAGAARRVAVDHIPFAREPDGRAFVYGPQAGRKKTMRRLLGDLLGRAFDGSASLTVSD